MVNAASTQICPQSAPILQNGEVKDLDSEPAVRSSDDEFLRRKTSLRGRTSLLHGADCMQRLQHYERPFVADTELIDDRRKRFRGFRHRRRRDAGFAGRVLRGGRSRHCVLIVDHGAVANRVVIAKDVETNTGLCRCWLDHARARQRYVSDGRNMCDNIENVVE